MDRTGKMHAARCLVLMVEDNDINRENPVRALA